MKVNVGNQLPILLISFCRGDAIGHLGWESVTDPLDKLYRPARPQARKLGISYRSS